MKTINSTLQTHKGLHATTLTNILLVGPLPDATYRGFSSLMTDIAYNDGNGSVTYRAHTGVQFSAFQASADLGVDNAEADTLVPIVGYEVYGFTQEQLDEGALDKVPFVVYRVNYNDLTTGRHEIIGGGTIGEQRTKFGQLTVLELLSLSAQLKQSIGELDSITCRAKFGSQVGDERFPCEFDFAAEWVSGSITAVSAEPDLMFTDSALGVSQPTADYFAPGVMEALDGDNVGLTREVDGYTAGVITLQFPFPNPMAIGDTYRIRRDCSKAWTGHNSCDTFWSTDKPNHFRGEPHIMPGGAAQLTTPGAAISASGSGGTGEPFSREAT